MQREELAAWLRLVLTPGVGNEAARRLLAAFGLPQALFAQPEAALKQIVTPAQARALHTPPKGWEALLEQTWDWLVQPAPSQTHRILTLSDPDYPPALLATIDPPLMLYMIGPHACLATAAPRCIAIVGSRNPTAQGLENARAFGRGLADAGLTVVSGLALGIDGAAHEGALSASFEAPMAPTIAVVGTGLDRVYPRQHLALAHRISQQGFLVSEFPLGTPPLAPNFPKRNRLIAGLSQGTLVIEAALASGSLVTARLATEQGREVFAVPGSIHAMQSRGCHALIRQGAKLVENLEDILEELPNGSRAATAQAARSNTSSASSSGSAAAEVCDPLLDLMGFDPVSLDALQARSGWNTPALQARLLDFEIEGSVVRLPGGLFQRLVTA